MAELIFKTESIYFGPWLLDKEALDALDSIIDEQWKLLENHKKQQIEMAVRRERDRLSKTDANDQRSEDQRKVDDKETRQRVENDYAGDDCTITLTFSSGDKVHLGRCREAAGDKNCQDREVTKAKLKIRCGGISGDLVVPTPDKNHGLSLVTLPEASERAVELYVRLNRWAEQFKPGFLRRLQSTPPGLLVFLAGALMVMVAMLGIATRVIPTKTNWRTEARELVTKGVKPEDHGRALELLLRQSAGLDNDIGFLQLPPWYLVTFAVVMAEAILLSFGASTAFEIGKGTARVRRQKGYSTFLRRSIPGFLLSGVLASMFGGKLLELLWPK